MTPTKINRQPVATMRPAQTVLPHVQVALENLLVKFRTDPTYLAADTRTAELLVKQLAKQGIRLLPTMTRVALGTPEILDSAETLGSPEDAVGPRRINYNQRQVHGLVKKALSEQWPETAFYLRSTNSCTTVYYLADNGGPDVDEVEAVALGYEGVNPQGGNGWEAVWHERTGDDGQLELVSYGTNYFIIAAVTTHGRAENRRDGLTHAKSVYPLSLRQQLIS